jgi:hypothetical protein
MYGFVLMHDFLPVDSVKARRPIAASDDRSRFRASRLWEDDNHFHLRIDYLTGCVNGDLPG